MTTILLVLAATSLSAQTSAEVKPDGAPPLITSTEVQPGDSALVQAAKRATAARQKAKGRDVAVTPGKGGHIFQATGPANVSFNMPPEAKKPAAAKKRPSGIDVAALERQLQKLLDEQQRIGAQGDEPVGGDGGVEEDQADQRMSILQKQIDDVRRQIAAAKGGNPPR